LVISIRFTPSESGDEHVLSLYFFQIPGSVPISTVCAGLPGLQMIGVRQNRLQTVIWAKGGLIFGRGPFETETDFDDVRHLLSAFDRQKTSVRAAN
jgi:hypothetical protein